MPSGLMLGDGVARPRQTKKTAQTGTARGKVTVTPSYKTAPKAVGAQMQMNLSGGGGGYSAPSYGSSAPITSSVSGTSAVPAVEPTPAPKPVSDEDWLAGDSTYQAALAALKKTLAGYQGQYDTSKTNYDTDYNSSLKNLGWNQDAGSWNQDDTNTAYGRSFENQLNDFAARDMLQSSFYGDALNDMLRQFNDQKSDLSTGRARYMTDLGNTLAQQKNENDLAKQQARAESIARKAAGISSTVG